MTSVDYIVVANIIGDDLVFPEGNRRSGILGGAGTYAAAGARIWAERVGIVSGVGEDFGVRYGSWFEQNQIDTTGLHVRGPATPRSWIVYKSADERIETPQFGPEHFMLMEPTIDDIPPSYLDARGLYLFRDANMEYWNNVFEFQKAHHPTLIWELHAAAANSQSWGNVSAILSRVDLFSLNLPEAMRLCNLTEPAEILDRLLSTGIAGIALRSGAQGTIVADQSGAWRIPVYNLDVVDVTGAGNAFTGGFLVGYCESYSDIVTAGQYGAISASFMLQQFGPPTKSNSEIQQLAKSRMESLTPINLY